MVNDECCNLSILLCIGTIVDGSHTLKERKKSNFEHIIIYTYRQSEFRVQCIATRWIGVKLHVSSNERLGWELSSYKSSDFSVFQGIF